MLLFSSLLLARLPASFAADCGDSGVERENASGVGGGEWREGEEGEATVILLLTRCATEPDNCDGGGDVVENLFGKESSSESTS